MWAASVDVSSPLFSEECIRRQFCLEEIFQTKVINKACAHFNKCCVQTVLSFWLLHTKCLGKTELTVVHKILGNCGHRKEREESSAGRLQGRKDTEWARRKAALVQKREMGKGMMLQENDRKYASSAEDYKSYCWVELSVDQQEAQRLRKANIPWEIKNSLQARHHATEPATLFLCGFSTSINRAERWPEHNQLLLSFPRKKNKPYGEAWETSKN